MRLTSYATLLLEGCKISQVQYPQVVVVVVLGYYMVSINQYVTNSDTVQLIAI